MTARHERCNNATYPSNRIHSIPYYTIAFRPNISHLSLLEAKDARNFIPRPSLGRPVLLLKAITADAAQVRPGDKRRVGDVSPNNRRQGVGAKYLQMILVDDPEESLDLR